MTTCQGETRLLRQCAFGGAGACRLSSSIDPMMHGERAGRYSGNPLAGDVPYCVASPSGASVSGLDVSTLWEVAAFSFPPPINVKDAMTTTTLMVAEQAHAKAITRNAKSDSNTTNAMMWSVVKASIQNSGGGSE